MIENKRTKESEDIDCLGVKETLESRRNSIESLEMESRRAVKRTSAKRVKFPRCIGLIV